MCQFNSTVHVPVNQYNYCALVSQLLCELTHLATCQLNSTIAPLAQVREKQKDFLDPLNSVRKYLGCEGVRLTMKK